jgi:hypothetical protein
MGINAALALFKRIGTGGFPGINAPVAQFDLFAVTVVG